MAMQDFVRRHIIWAVRAGAADAYGNEDLSRCLYAQTKLRLICASDEELWELAKLLSLSQMPVELAYEETKRAIEEHKARVSEWIRDLGKEPIFDEGSESDR